PDSSDSVACYGGARLGVAAGAGEHSPAEIDVPTAQADPQPLREHLDARVGEMRGQRLERVGGEGRFDLGTDSLGGEREVEHADLVWRQVERVSDDGWSGG